MPYSNPSRSAASRSASSPRRLSSPLPHLAKAVAVGLLVIVSAVPATADPSKNSVLEKEPLATAEMQSLADPQDGGYSTPNALVMYQPQQEDPLSFYSRTEDGEWQIPSQVDATDPWVRVLLLAPGKPTVVDVAIEINHHPFRAAREQWIDKLLSEARQEFLVRTGVAEAQTAGIESASTDEVAANEDASMGDEQSQDADSEETDGSEGTSEQTAASDDSEDGESNESVADKALEEPENEESEKAEDKVPMVEIQRRQTSTLFKRLVNYLAADQSTAEREEVRWLLAEWTGGPATLTLGPSLSWQRADSAPLWYTLDQDRDHVLSSEEISAVDKAFQHADINRDDIVDLGELERLAKEHAPSQRTKGYPLLIVLDENTDWRVLRRHLKNAYPAQVDTTGERSERRQSLLKRIAQGDRSLGSNELAKLMSVPSDVTGRVSFADEDALVALLAVSNTDGAKGWRFHSSTDDVLTVESEETYLEISAAQGEIDTENTSGDMQQTQVAIGAVVDGYPLLRLLDHDGNRKLTQRERSGVREFLAALDRNQDGQVEFAELPLGIRFMVTHGPKVHQSLAKAISAQRQHTEAVDVAAPAWFIGMDRNKDGDLSKREFKGSPAQFAKYDSDGDGLISPSEAQ